MNKTILITGSTDGIGKLAAEKLAKEGHRVFLHGRNSEKLQAVVAEIQRSSGNDRVKGFTADFSDLKAVQSMAQEVVQTISQLDVLINNAGVFKSPETFAPNGLDLRFVVNYLAPYLLTQSLIPLVKKSPSPRIINLSSAAQAPVSMEALHGKQELSSQASYAQSKLALTMWSFHLAKEHPTVAVTAVNPGSLLNTNMVREGYGRYWSSADKGGNILYDLAVAAEYEGVSGKYFDNDLGQAKGTWGTAHQDAYDDELVRELMKVTELVVG
ncbi:MAG: SDR family NAD(P)-dependent oxidoreductase [Bacteroidota bacterium]